MSVKFFKIEKMHTEINDLLLEYLKLNNPDKLNYSPKVVEIIGSIVVFEMKRHDHLYCVSINSLKLNV